MARINPQTMPSWAKSMVVAPKGQYLMNIDLRQAETRYVAWDAPDPKLMEMLELGQDIHRFVASHIFSKPESEVTDQERQLGKKSGHGANYDMGPRTFQDQCLKDMDLALKLGECKKILATYHRIFPGVRRRQERIASEVRTTKRLRTPMGRERHFFGRVGPDLFREAYAYGPQSTIPDIINCLMRKVQGQAKLVLQTHDSLLLEGTFDQLQHVASVAQDLSAWHPEINLRGGRLQIPIEIQWGMRWSDKHDWTGENIYG